MPLREFRTEVRCANQLLNLHADIRARNLKSLRRLFTTAPAAPDQSDTTIIDRYLEERWGRPLGGKVISRAVERGTLSSIPPERYYGPAVSLLASAMTYMMRNISLSLTDNVWPPSPPGSPLILKRTWICPDLLSAMYLQFYLLIVANKPLRRCESPACRQPFVMTRKDKRFCDQTCRSNARNYR